MFQQDRPRKKYPSDLTDEPWAIVAPLLPPAKQHKRGGHPSTVDIREVRNTIFSLPRLVTILAEQQYHNHALDAWLAEHRTGWRMEAKVRPEGMKGFTPLEKRWVIERTNAWNGRYRRNSKDYERRVESSTTMIQMSNIHLMLNRLALCGRPAFHYRKDAA